MGDKNRKQPKKKFVVWLWAIVGVLFLVGFGIATTIITDQKITTPKVQNIVYVTCVVGDIDCGPEINSALSSADYGDIVLINNLQIPIQTTINLKYGVLLKGKYGMQHLMNSYPDNNLTSLLWTGSVGGIMINGSSANLGATIGTFGLNDLMLDGNYIAGYGLYMSRTNNRARHLDLRRLSFERINGPAIEFGGMVDDTSLYDVSIENGGNNSVGIANPNSMVKMFGGVIAVQNKSAVELSNTNFGPSIIFYGTVFSGNYVQFLLNTSQVIYGISCENCWIEAVGAGGVVNLVKYTATILDLSFTNSNIDTDLADTAFNLSIAPAGTKLNIFGGRTYVGPGTKIAANTNVSVVFLNHLYSDSYTISGAPNINRIENGAFKYGTGIGSLYQTADNDTVLQSAGGLTLSASGTYPDAYFYIRNSNFYGNISIPQQGGSGNAIVCFTNVGRIYRGNLTGCP